MGLSLFYSSLLHEFRIAERVRLTWKWWWAYGSSDEAPLRKPVKVLARIVNENIQNGDGGSIRILVSPQMIATPSLEVAVVTLVPGAEMPSQTSRGVEFYYVLSGNGQFSQQFVNDTSYIGHGDGFAVDPGVTRWMSNSRGTEDLILLRVTDAGRWRCTINNDILRIDPNLRSLANNGISALGQVANGVRRVNEMAKGYVNKTSITSEAGVP
jgi:mannose-6-phosphate isomerase-like protein (cupin superfamily)